MGAKIDPSSNRSAAIWSLAQAQYGVLTRGQLLALGLSSKAIRHRIATGRLYPVHPGVYAVGRPGISQHGHWMAAVLACGSEAILSHLSAAALWGIRVVKGRLIEVSVPAHCRRRRAGIAVHRRAVIRAEDVTRRDGVPVTTPICTLVDIAVQLDSGSLETAVNEADRRGLADPETLRRRLDEMAGLPGSRILRRVLDRRTFALTDSELERRFLPLARGAGLPSPATQQVVNGFRVDFHWPELGLVVETDGLRYHRTAAQQARDRVRDQTHAATGLTPLRFTHAQVTFEPALVQETLRAVADRLSR